MRISDLNHSEKVFKVISFVFGRKVSGIMKIAYNV